MAPKEEELTHCTKCDYSGPRNTFTRCRVAADGRPRYRKVCRKCWSKYLLKRRAERSDQKKRDQENMKAYSTGGRIKKAKFVVLDGKSERYFQIYTCAKKYADKVDSDVVSIKQGEDDATSTVL